MEAKASKHTWVGGGKQQLSEHQRINKVSDPQVIGENPASRGTVRSIGRGSCRSARADGVEVK